MNLPLVTVICTTYNHEKYVEETLYSVINQTYLNIELIIVDNASTDATLQKVESFCERYPHVRRITNAWNKGLCAAFNQGFSLSGGNYVIDLSADDVLLPERIERQVSYFETLPERYGVIFSNARYIDRDSRPLRVHYGIDEYGKTFEQIPTGDVYRDVLENYFICTPTMMIRRWVIEELGGYDESLCYEDFDFWVRSAVLCEYAYQDEVLTHKRLLAKSLSSQVYQPGSNMLKSTYSVCNKAYDLNRNQEEFDALARRIRTFIRKCFYAHEFELAIRFRKLLNYIEDPDPATEFIILLCRLRLPVNRLYRLYINLNRLHSAKRGILRCM
jgi:glycosyltransferase involved in cell wall biosynthesis